jgi:RIO kinase 1
LFPFTAGIYVCGFVNSNNLPVKDLKDMKPDDYLNLMNELDEEVPPETFEKIIKTTGRGHPAETATSRHKQPRRMAAPKKTTSSAAQFIHSQDDSFQSFEFTYPAARFEEGWLLDSLRYFYEQHWISDVWRKIKVGKEASVYLCQSGEQVQTPLVAAKVYRPRMLRNLKNDQLYREGRQVLDENGHQVVDLGMLKAQHKRSVYGEQIRHQSWIAHEFYTLRELYDAGADVPFAYEMAPKAILMSYLGDERLPAPSLNEVTLKRGEAAPLFKRILHNLHLLLACGRIHGDLSAYNILYWNGNILLIDFPQVIPVHGNRNAYKIFHRDVTRVSEYFINQGLSLEPDHLAAQLWTEHGYPLAPQVHPLLLDADDPRDRQLWKDT